jgi:hypothetical protein
VLKARDKNGDGVLSFQEYIGDRGEGKDKEWLLTEKDRYESIHISKLRLRNVFLILE